MEEKIPSLSDLMKMIAEEKQKQQPKYTVDKLELNLNETINNMFAELTGKPIEEKVIKQEIVVDVPQPVIIENNLGLLGGDASTKTEDPLTPLDQNFVTHEDLSRHYKTFIQRVQQQLSTIGGGGETKFLRLDDVNAKSKNDNWVLEYDEQSGTVKFTDRVGPISTLRFDTTHIAELEPVGTLTWSVDDDTLNITHPNGVVQQVGQETYGYVRNQTGFTITNGSAVQFAGAEQNGTARLLVAPFQANNEFPTLYGFGIATEDIPNGADGRITVWGKVRGVNTSAFNVGDILFVSPDSAGGLTNIRPTAPNNVIPMAAVLRSDSAEGELFVRPSYEQQKNYGTFISDSNQTISLANTAQIIRINKTNFAQKMFIDSNYAVVTQEPGLYTFSVNLQVISTNSSTKDVYTWIRLNDSDIPRSSRKTSLTGNNQVLVITALHNVSMTAGDRITHMIAATDAAVALDASTATAFAPSSPSVVIKVDQTAL